MSERVKSPQELLTERINYLTDRAERDQEEIEVLHGILHALSAEDLSDVYLKVDLPDNRDAHVEPGILKPTVFDSDILDDSKLNSDEYAAHGPRDS